jgi:hypothetical protein
MVVEKMNDLEEDGDAMDICNAGNDWLGKVMVGILGGMNWFWRNIIWR